MSRLVNFWSSSIISRICITIRVYSLFQNQPLHFETNRKLFEAEEQDLFQDLQTLPRNAAIRKLNDLVKRARLAKVHAYIISSLKKEMPAMFGKDAKKKELIKNLPATFTNLQKKYQITPGDFPDVAKMQEVLKVQDFTKFKSLDDFYLKKVDSMLSSDIARLMKMIPNEEQEDSVIRGGAFDDVLSKQGPFMHGGM